MTPEEFARKTEESLRQNVACGQERELHLIKRLEEATAKMKALELQNGELKKEVEMVRALLNRSEMEEGNANRLIETLKNLLGATHGMYCRETCPCSGHEALCEDMSVVLGKTEKRNDPCPNCGEVIRCTEHKAEPRRHWDPFDCATVGPCWCGESHKT